MSLTVNPDLPGSPEPASEHVRPWRVLYGDDHELLAVAFQGLLERDERFESAGYAVGGRALVETYQRMLGEGEAPDVVLSDMSMPEVDGQLVCRELLAADPEAKIVIVSAFSDAVTVRCALEAGAAGYLSKNSGPGQLLDALWGLLCDGTPAFDSYTTAVAMAALALRVGDQELTQRQLEVLTCVAEGMSRKQIARLLHVNLTTIKSHMANIFERLGASNSREAVRRAQELGLLATPEPGRVLASPQT